MESVIFEKSSVLYKASYEKSSEIMYITFKNGREYQFHRVPEILWNNFINAESKGRFFTQNIKGKYMYIG